jgi:hypothetical protein
MFHRYRLVRRIGSGNQLSEPFGLREYEGEKENEALRIYRHQHLY